MSGFNLPGTVPFATIGYTAPAPAVTVTRVDFNYPVASLPVSTLPGFALTGVAYLQSRQAQVYWHIRRSKSLGVLFRPARITKRTALYLNRRRTPLLTQEIRPPALPSRARQDQRNRFDTYFRKIHTRKPWHTPPKKRFAMAPVKIFQPGATATITFQGGTPIAIGLHNALVYHLVREVQRDSGLHKVSIRTIVREVQRSQGSAATLVAVRQIVREIQRSEGSAATLVAVRHIVREVLRSAGSLPDVARRRRRQMVLPNVGPHA